MTNDSLRQLTLIAPTYLIKCKIVVGCGSQVSDRQMPGLFVRYLLYANATFSSNP
ncbi:hypothetical protein LC605_13020 [Nostoc sp. CHAB 5836]|nr:hypothetical protein [Nostoc sp. CHAB 5836]